jgi:hypothetical protein
MVVIHVVRLGLRAVDKQCFYGDFDLESVVVVGLPNTSGQRPSSRIPSSRQDYEAQKKGVYIVTLK